MKKNLKITPEGMKDFLFAECSAMDDVCGKIEKMNFHVYFYFDDVARCPDRIFVAQPFEDS